ncbi:hypothetical protein PRABACTJOHN_03620 [Parabacteroides johnsonii DSM 18315]|uniref:Uncharacterized protein n=1 Tax=Parabacteroides johnsonii DSM 18315 TaxID=537006 RepID=B7BEZ1_9BACT|nr:hypothetical protein PRABACTJOHN_03620 [Parabacteroides johnsonii DSM 18315]
MGDCKEIPEDRQIAVFWDFLYEYKYAGRVSIKFERRSLRKIRWWNPKNHRRRSEYGDSNRGIYLKILYICNIRQIFGYEV